MAKLTRLSKAAREFNVGISTIVDFLSHKGVEIDANPNTKLEENIYDLLAAEFNADLKVKKASDELNLRRKSKESISIEDVSEKPEVEESEKDDELTIKTNTIKPDEIKTEVPRSSGPKVIGKIDLNPKPKPSHTPVKEDAPIEEIKVVEEQKIETPVQEAVVEEEQEDKSSAKDSLKVVGTIDLDALNQKTRPKKKTKAEKEAEKEQRKIDREQEVQIAKHKAEELEAEKTANIVEEPQKPVSQKPVEEIYRSKVEQLAGPKVLGKIELKEEKKPQPIDKKKKRKRIKKEKINTNDSTNQSQNHQHNQNQGFNKFAKNDQNKKKVQGKKKIILKPEVSDEDVQKQVKETLARLTNKQKGKGAKYRRDKRDADREKVMQEIDRAQMEKNIIKVTEFVSVNELASMMEASVTDVISTCMSLGLFVSINQRLDAETMALVADEFGFKVEFVSVEVQEAIAAEVDTESDLLPRPPIVTVMGHVDHGKTKLLDYIRSANVVAGEAGGITQHIGAYSVETDEGKHITFLDTPGHEAFTAMRARGAQVTDVVIIVVAADDGIMPQTKEAINHASAAGVPIVFAVNKIDKPAANPDRIKEELANMNYLVEEWGGKYQSQDISALKGLNVDLLLEKVLLEAEMLDLKANPNKRAIGSVIESELDKGRGYVSTVLVAGGTLRIGDVVLAGSYYGHVKAMYNERGKKITEAGPSTPVQILGLNGAPPAGDNFNVMSTDAEARNIANKREQLERQQSLRTKKHITLDEIGRRLAVGNFQELNVIVKGDVDGSIEALTDSFVKLSTAEIQVNVIHKAVGEISESDVMLANASNAIIIGFQVRPSLAARKLAEKEEIEIRLYSIIYDAINELKDAMSGMLSPEIKEEIVATLEVLETFKITKVGTVAGCMVREGKIKRNTKIRLIRDGIVTYTGLLGSLKRFKDDVKEVQSGYDCGLNIDKFNDIKVGDIIEGYEEKEVARTL
ncbi:MAG: translation initiation factor IF-2 [Bacteroidales bacterium]|nr:translation initiation factor IF-2 [Bacteroidales bacterium]